MFVEIKKNALENFGECYICFEYTNELSKCLCKNLFLHIECQRKFIDVYKKLNCGICKNEFSNVIIKNNFCNINFCYCYKKSIIELEEANINICKKTNNIIITN